MELVSKLQYIKATFTLPHTASENRVTRNVQRVPWLNLWCFRYHLDIHSQL